MDTKQIEAEHEEFRKLLNEAGWVVRKDPLSKGGAELDFYACRKATVANHLCVSSEAPPLLLAKLWHFYPGLYDNYSIVESKIAEIIVEGAIQGDHWVMFKTSCSWDTLLDKNLTNKYETILSAAYDAALGLFRTDDDKSLDKNIYLCNNLVNEGPLAQ